MASIQAKTPRKRFTGQDENSQSSAKRARTKNSSSVSPKPVIHSSEQSTRDPQTGESYIPTGSASATLDAETDQSIVHSQHSSLCSRCEELGLPVTWLELDPDRQNCISHSYINVVVQRLIFDFNIPLIPSCFSCKYLQLADRKRLRLGAKPHRSSWLEISRTEVVRCRQKKLEIEYRGGRLISANSYPKARLPSTSKVIDVLRPLSAKCAHTTSIPEYFARKVSHYKIDYRPLSSWLSTCGDNHATCKPLWDPELRTINLIDVQAHELVKYPLEEECRYVALSYVWGDTQPYRFKLGRLPCQILATIDDTVQVVKNLGLRYLWVDAICINQTDRVHQMNQIKIMNSVYSGAYATIISLNGASAQAGLPRVSHMGSSKKQHRAVFGPNQLVSTMPPLWKQIEQSPWSKRGWTFQEGLFSRRCLLFTNHQVYFHCNNMQSCEAQDKVTMPDESDKCLAIQNPFLRSLSGLTFANKHGLFIKMINEYSSRHLSVRKDVLNAVAGLLHQFENILFPEGFYFGLPKEDFRYSLSWKCSHSSLPGDQTRRPPFPSWSWAGWSTKSPIELHEELALEQPPLSVWTDKGEPLILSSARLSNLSSSNLASPALPAMTSFLVLFKRSIKCSSDAESRIVPNRACKTFLTVHGAVMSIKLLLHNSNVNRHYRSFEGGGLQCKLKTRRGIQCEGVAHITGDWEEVKESQVSPNSRPIFPSQPRDFLFLSLHSVGTGHDTLRATLLLLDWKEGIAYRKGLVYIDDLKILTLLDCRPRMTKFLLG